MPDKHSATHRVGGPGAAHENARDPARNQPRGRHPTDQDHYGRSGVSGGGGEADVHQERNDRGKSGH